MSYSQADLTTEIKQIVEQALKDDVATSAAFIAMAVVARHPLPSNWTGDHKDFAIICIHHHVRGLVKDVLKAMKASRDDITDPQMTMEGFSRLQKAYIIERNNDLTVVPIEQCSDEELQAKADELQVKIDGMIQHRNEILRYIRQRRKVA